MDTLMKEMMHKGITVGKPIHKNMPSMVAEVLDSQVLEEVEDLESGKGGNSEN